VGRLSIGEMGERHNHAASCGAAIRTPAQGEALREHLSVDSRQRNPKGAKESSRWSESAETTGTSEETNRTPTAWPMCAVKYFWMKLKMRREFRVQVLHPSGVCRKKDFLCVTLWNLRASVVKLLREINHRGTEIAQRTTEFGFPDRPSGVRAN